MIIRGQLHDNSCKKNVLNNSVLSVSSVLKTKKLKVSIPPKPEAAPFGGRGAKLTK